MGQRHVHHRLFWSVAIGWLAIDILTKRLALASLIPGTPVPVVGDLVRLTLTFNRGAALGLSLGDWSRPAFTLIGFVMVGVLIGVYRAAPRGQRLRVVLLALITGGAIGNLIDRIRWAHGVVDFIDIGVGPTRFWTFNVADVGISVSAIILAIAWSRDGRDNRDTGDSG